MKSLTSIIVASVILAACTGQSSASICADIARDVDLTGQEAAQRTAEMETVKDLSLRGLSGLCDDQCARESTACVGQPDFSRCMIDAEDRSHVRFDRSIADLLGERWRRPAHDSDGVRREWEQFRSDAIREELANRNGALSEALFRHADALGRSVDALTEGRCAAE